MRSEGFYVNEKSTDISWYFFFYFIHACLWYSSTWFNRHDIRELRRRYNADNGKGDRITSDDYISTFGSITALSPFGIEIDNIYIS